MSAGQSSSKAKSNNQNSSQFNQNIPAFQSDALTELYGNAKNLYTSNLPNVQALQPEAQKYIGNINQAALPAFQNSLQGGVYGGLDIGNQLSQSLQQSNSNPSNTSKIYADIMGGQGNNYADALKASYLGDANRATDAMLANLDTRAAAAGMSGGSRHGLATSQGLYDINSNLQKNLAQTGYDTFNQDLNNKLNIASQADQNTLARQQLMSDMLGSQQGTINGGLQGAANMQNLALGSFAPTMVPWDSLLNYASVIGAPTVLSNGSSQGSGNSKAFGQSGSAGLT